MNDPMKEFLESLFGVKIWTQEEFNTFVHHKAIENEIMEKTIIWGIPIAYRNNFAHLIFSTASYIQVSKEISKYSREILQCNNDCPLLSRPLAEMKRKIELTIDESIKTSNYQMLNLIDMVKDVEQEVVLEEIQNWIDRILDKNKKKIEGK